MRTADQAQTKRKSIRLHRNSNRPLNTLRNLARRGKTRTIRTRPIPPTARRIQMMETQSREQEVSERETQDQSIQMPIHSTRRSNRD